MTKLDRYIENRLQHKFPWRAKMTQHDRIMDYLNRRTKDGKHYVLTPMKAFSRLGITKLSTRIGELIERGEHIYKLPVCKKKEGRYGRQIYVLYAG